MSQTALHVASSRNLLGIAKLLIMFGAEPNHKDIAGRTALFFAVKYSFQEMTTTLIANFSSCFMVDKYNQSLIQTATDPVIKIMVEKGKLYQILNRLKYRMTDAKDKRNAIKVVRETIFKQKMWSPLEVDDVTIGLFKSKIIR